MILEIYFYINTFFSLIKNSKRDLCVFFVYLHFFSEKPTKRKSTIKLAWHHVKNSMQNRISLVRPLSNFFSLNFHFAGETWPITVGYIIICQVVDMWQGGATAKNWYRPIGKVPPPPPPPPPLPPPPLPPSEIWVTYTRYIFSDTERIFSKGID